MDKDLNSLVARLAGEYFAQGLNCCENIIRTMLDLSGLDMPDQLVNMGRHFSRGMGAGCTCGALAGGVMMLGLLKPEAADLGQELHKKFIDEYGSACCRTIRKKHGILDRVTNDKCRDITARTAEIVIDIWRKV